METEHQNNSPSNLHPFLGIWIRTREVISQAMKEKNQTTVRLLIYAFGIVMSLNLSLTAYSGDFNSIPYILIQALIRGILFGFVGWYGFSGLIYWIGKLFKGAGTFKEIKVAFAWAQVPMVFILFIIWPLNYLVFGNELFTSNTAYLGWGQMALNFFVIVAEFIINVWYLVIVSKAIGVGHNVSGWKGFAIYIITALAFILVIFSVMTFIG